MDQIHYKIKHTWIVFGSKAGVLPLTVVFLFCPCLPSPNSSSVLDFSFDRSDELPLEVFEDIFASYEKRK